MYSKVQTKLNKMQVAHLLGYFLFQPNILVILGAYGGKGVKD